MALCPTNIHAKPLRVHVVGFFFKNETFAFTYNQKRYVKHVVKGQNQFAFNIEISDSFMDSQRVDLHVSRKARFGRFKNTQVEIDYNLYRKYLVLYRSHRLKNRYAFEVFWSNTPMGYGNPEIFLDDSIPNNLGVDTIIHLPLKGAIKTSGLEGSKSSTKCDGSVLVYNSQLCVFHEEGFTYHWREISPTVLLKFVWLF